MNFTDDQYIGWLLRPEKALRDGYPATLRITEAHLRGEGIAIPRLSWVFLAGFLTSLIFVGLAAYVLMIGMPERNVFLLLAAPNLIVFYFLGGELAIYKQPVTYLLLGFYSLVLIAVALAVLYFAPQFTTALIVAVACLYGGYSALTYFRAWQDTIYTRSAETVHAIKTKIAKPQRNRFLRDTYGAQIHTATIKAEYRDAEDKSTVIPDSVAKIGHLNAQGRQEATRQLEILIAQYEQKLDALR